MSRSDNEPSLHDEAARAGWLYYVGGMTQDQIATELGVSRQRAQRLVSRAMAEGLIHVRLNHRIGACLDLEAALTDRFSLTRCRVAPSLGTGADPARAIAPAAAAELERYLRLTESQVIAFGTGRALRGMAEQLAPTDARQHRIVSLLGNIAPDGSATLYDVISRIAEKLNAPYYPMPAKRCIAHALLREDTMNKTLRALFGATAMLTLAGAAMAETTITVATVNNGDMIRMQGLMDDFYAKNPDIKVEWVTLEENVLRQTVTTDIATKGGQFDVLTIGTYEVPIWGKQGWLVSLNDLPADYGS